MHPDKICDRIAGAIVDLAYKKQENPKIAVEVLVGHGYGHVVIETSVEMEKEDVAFIVDRFAPGIRVFIQIVPQDVHLAENQSKEIRCGDNGIFKGMPLTEEQKELEAEKQRLREIQPALNRAEELGYPNMELLKTKTKKEIFDIMTIWKATEGK